MVVLKVLILPIVTRTIAIAMGANLEEQAFVFEYSLLPAAASALVMCYQLGAPPSMMPMLGGAYAIGKALSILLLVIFAALLTVRSEGTLDILISHFSQ